MSGSITYGILTKDPDRSKWKKTIGYVVARTYGRVGTRIFKYKVDGVVYESRGEQGLRGETLGDAYEILYNPRNPEKIYVLDHRPVFLEHEQTNFTEGVIVGNVGTSQYRNYLNLYPKYKYFAQGRKFIRAQQIQIPVDSSIHIEKGMKFRVQYWVQNPQRSILLYNEPVE